MAAKELAQLEREIQNLIQRLDSLSTTIFKDEKGHPQETEEEVKCLRQHMRKIRRWRNGSEKPTKHHVGDIQRELHNTRKKWLKLEVQTLTESSKQSLNTDPLNRVLVQTSLEFLQQKMEDLPDSYTEIIEIERLIIQTKSLIEKIRKDGKNSDKIGTEKLKETDHNYNVLSQKAMRVRVLTLMRKLRILLMGLGTKNGHQPVSGAAGCAANDINALGRQLRRVQIWLHGNQEVREYHIEDMELILDALGRHLKMDVLLSCENEVDSDEEELGSILMSKSDSGQALSTSEEDVVVTVMDKDKEQETITEITDENDNSKRISQSHNTELDNPEHQHSKDTTNTSLEEEIDDRLI